MSRTEEILEQIDDAIADWEVGPDAVRFNAPPEARKPLRPLVPGSIRPRRRAGRTSERVRELIERGLVNNDVAAAFDPLAVVPRQAGRHAEDCPSRRPPVIEHITHPSGATEARVTLTICEGCA